MIAVGWELLSRAKVLRIQRIDFSLLSCLSSILCTVAFVTAPSVLRIDTYCVMVYGCCFVLEWIKTPD